VEPSDDARSLVDMSYSLQASSSSASESRLALFLPSHPTDQDRGDNPEFIGDSFSSSTVFRLMNWMWSGSQLKSVGELNRPVHEVLLAPDFNVDDLQAFNARCETARLDSAITSGRISHTATLSSALDAWRETEVQIPIPDGRTHKHRTDPPIPYFSVSGLHHRSLTGVIKVAWTDHNTAPFEYLPFRQFWQRKPGITESIRDEVFSSEAFIDAHNAVQNLPAEPGCTLERSVCALMLWSDSTHLASFGTSSLWPIYLSFGNQSKYFRAATRSSCHHLAYIPKVSFFSFSFLALLDLQIPASRLIRRLLQDTYWHKCIGGCVDTLPA